MADEYFRHVEQATVNVIFIPDGWRESLIDPEGAGDVYGYGPTRLVSNDPEIETLWFPVARLTDAISEAEARRIHPALFAHLDRIDAGLA